MKLNDAIELVPYNNYIELKFFTNYLVATETTCKQLVTFIMHPSLLWAALLDVDFLIA